MSKETQWKGYYDPYFKKAQERSVNPLEVLNQEWFDGQKTAEEKLLPYISSDSVVLEIACGIGRVSKYAAANCKTLFCTDILEEALNETRSNLKDFNNVVYKKINGYNLSLFQENYFDCVYSFTTFFHFDFELVINYFSEIKRVLKPGGIGIIEFKRWESKADIVELLDKIKEEDGVEKYERELDKWRYVSLEMLKVVCDYFNFKIIDNDITQFTFKSISD